jgi:hypothetical protein
VLTSIWKRDRAESVFGHDGHASASEG